MTRKTRLIILLICVALFIIIAPYLVLYSLGYRVDFLHQKITATGGIYVRAEPIPVAVTIDEDQTNTTGYFSNAVFVQNLAPGEHTVVIQKTGYYDYHKKLEVLEKEVTKLEEVTLFKTEIAFDQVPNTTTFSTLTKKPVNQFIIKNGNLYYANTPENARLTAAQKATPVIKNIVAFEASAGSIIWLATNGILNTFTTATKTSEPLSQIPYLVNTKKAYTLKTLAGNMFLMEGTTAFIFNKTTATFEPFYTTINDFVLSPDTQKITYYNDHELWYWLPKTQVQPAKILLQQTKETITQVYWINNNYIAFVAGNSIMITEIDPRGNVNVITLPQTIMVNENTVTIKNPQMFFDLTDKKLYIKTGETVYISERLAS